MGSHVFKPICLLIVLLFISKSWLCESRAIIHGGSTKSIAKGIEMLIDGLHIEGIKTGGPSDGGEGHGASKAVILGEKKAGGPSDGGVGHKFPNAAIIGGRKLGGRSIRVGILGAKKSGGPSAGGTGHAFTNSQILGAHPQSGPSPGEGH